ncbi:MAG: septum formation family protein [Marmoricola sp.]
MSRLRLLPLLLAALLTGCGGGAGRAKAEAPASSGTATPSATSTATPSATPTTRPRVPKVADCYRLDLKAATSPTSGSGPVSCKARHTAVTVFVGRIDPVVDGHLLAVDAKEVQDQIATTCPTKVPGWVGGARQDQRLSRFTAIWFSPTLAESDAGADWFRCDVVAIGAAGQLASLPGTVKGSLSSSSALDAFGTCGTSAPSEKGFEQVICARPHTWRAATLIDIPQDAKYLGPNMQATGDNACKAEAQQRATDPLVYTWSFQWPTRDEWNAGRRYGLCWVPTGG